MNCKLIFMALLGPICRYVSFSEGLELKRLRQNVFYGDIILVLLLIRCLSLELIKKQFQRC